MARKAHFGKPLRAPNIRLFGSDASAYTCPTRTSVSTPVCPFMAPPEYCAIPCRARRRALLLAGAGALLGACGSAPTQQPPPPAAPVVLDAVTLQVTLIATDDVNPDVRGRASPLSVRIMELRSRSAFDAADFFSLYDREQATLGTELLAKEQYILRPGDTQGYTRKAQGETRFLGVVAAYRDLEGSNWRVAAGIAPPAPPVRGAPPARQRVTIRFGRAGVQMEVSSAA
jgi:type VI secretion system protein VasD